jgi:hypothetical protein
MALARVVTFEGVSKDRMEQSGDGDFSEATGVIHFKDDVTTGDADYTGHILL